MVFCKCELNFPHSSHTANGFGVIDITFDVFSGVQRGEQRGRWPRASSLWRGGGHTINWKNIIVPKIAQLFVHTCFS